MPLEQDILSTGPLKAKSNKKRKAQPEAEDAGYVDSKSSRKILKIGQDLADEEQEENAAGAPNPAFSFESRYGGENISDDDNQRYDDEEAWGDEDDTAEPVVCGSDTGSRLKAKRTAIGNRSQRYGCLQPVHALLYSQ